jgi:hypothetical protein
VLHLSHLCYSTAGFAQYPLECVEEGDILDFRKLVKKTRLLPVTISIRMSILDMCF